MGEKTGMTHTGRSEELPRFMSLTQEAGDQDMMLEVLLRQADGADALVAYPRLHLGCERALRLPRPESMTTFAPSWHVVWVVGVGVGLFAVVEQCRRSAGRSKFGV